LLVRPSVLDGGLSEAFYTAPPESEVGATIDLVVRNDKPWAEIIHPAVEFMPENIWSVGIIRTGLPASLSASRAHHALKLCSGAKADFIDLCQRVDGDIL
jgi:hypothetical protein